MTHNVLWSRTSVCVCVCVCVCLSATVCPHYCTDPDVTWESGRGCPLVVHYWADLQLVHGLRCYGNIMWTLVTSLRLSRDMTTLCEHSAGCACVRAASQWSAGDRGVLKIACRIWEVGVAGWPVTGRRQEAFSTLLRQPGLDCGLPVVAFWRHNANAKC